MIFLYQIIGSIIGLIAIILAILRFREGKMTIGMLSLWILIWIGVIYVSLDPGATNLFASFAGIGRGLDVVLILGLFGCYYLVFKIYTMIESMEKEITDLVRELALQRENIKSKSDVTSKKESK
ncbi:MAG: DUF2304 domain-containing protein [Methanobacterium sp.]|jgi:hypothetical protein